MNANLQELLIIAAIAITPSIVVAGTITALVIALIVPRLNRMEEKMDSIIELRKELEIRGWLGSHR